ncbi:MULTISPECIES: C39 family peptidase [unclassified Microcoleus]|uniref:C39 family peptidase n=1 Tax=unclassified Microcoleus TaxID=2642155 RepID=UPI002FD2390B
MKILSVRHFSQLDNVYHPEGTCNLTSAAMCLDYHGVRPKNSARQLEDELFEFVYDHKLSRHSAEDIAKVIAAFGCTDDFTWNGSIEKIKQSIDNNNPCIIHGMFTRSGHIIVVRGYDARGLIVNDPYGEYFAGGYDTEASGAGLNYSYELIRATCAYDGEFWVHHVSR